MHSCAPWDVGVAFGADLPAQLCSLGCRGGLGCRFACTLVLPSQPNTPGSTTVQDNLHQRPDRHCAGKSVSQATPTPQGAQQCRQVCASSHPNTPKDCNYAGESAPEAILTPWGTHLCKQIYIPSDLNTPKSTTEQAYLVSRPPQHPKHYICAGKSAPQATPTP